MLHNDLARLCLAAASLCLAAQSHGQASVRVLHHFAGSGVGDGGQPLAAPLQAASGALYGTTQNGGSDGFGTVFRLNADGSGYTVIHNFVAGDEDGGNPASGLVQGSDGVLYGTTESGSG